MTQYITLDQENIAVHAAFLLPPSEGCKANGLILAETVHDWVVWDVHTDQEYDCIWDRTNGHYFDHTEAGKAQAEFQFGLSLRRVLSEAAFRAIRMTSV